MLFVDGGNDRVGIGTNSPNSILEVESTQPNIRLTDSDNTHYARLGGSAGDLLIDADLGNGQSNSKMTFGVDGTERMRITSGGDVCIGGTNDVHTSSDIGTTLHILSETSGTDVSLHLHPDVGEYSLYAYNGYLAILDHTANTERMRIDSSGHITAPDLNQTGSTSNRYPLYWVHTGTTGSIEPYTGSVRAMKTDIADMGSVDWIHSLTPRSFKFRDYTTDSEGNRTYLETTNDLPNTEYGLIAEEVDEVTGSDYILDKDTDDNVKGVLYHNLVPILLKSIQELKTELDAAKARITTLEG
jgi:hypothetical protein